MGLTVTVDVEALRNKTILEETFTARAGAETMMLIWFPFMWHIWSPSQHPANTICEQMGIALGFEFVMEVAKFVIMHQFVLRPKPDLAWNWSVWYRNVTSSGLLSFSMEWFYRVMQL